MTIIGFTGTRKGMTDAQKRTVARTLNLIRPTTVHHGDCVGADADFHALARLADARIVLHPGMDARAQSPSRAFCEGDEERRTLPYNMRNLNIVLECDMLIACPHGIYEQRRGSGTWTTIRMARRNDKHIRIVWPDGTVTAENNPHPSEWRVSDARRRTGQ